MERMDGICMSTISHFDIKSLVELHVLKTFVETGTALGGAILHVSKLFNEFYSTEIETETFNTAKDILKNIDNIHLYNKDSVSFLEEILPELKTNSLFWLDAHYPGCGKPGVKWDKPCDVEVVLPLKKELELIKKNRSNFNDVIIIDDLRLYEQDVMTHPYKDDIVWKAPPFIDDIMKESYDIKKIYNDTGYVLITKKKI